MQFKEFHLKQKHFIVDAFSQQQAPPLFPNTIVTVNNMKHIFIKGKIDLLKYMMCLVYCAVIENDYGIYGMKVDLK